MTDTSWCITGPERSLRVGVLAEYGMGLCACGNEALHENETEIRCMDEFHRPLECHTDDGDVTLDDTEPMC